MFCEKGLHLNTVDGQKSQIMRQMRQDWLEQEQGLQLQQEQGRLNPKKCKLVLQEGVDSGMGNCALSPTGTILYTPLIGLKIWVLC
mmetsp:Transcript_34509/g.63439  ORF Transcript_34509/g.63439 Transcript_34509/m.63439 type:complete len:86 (+) Transcript_34509:2394-2651(+)